MRRKLQKKRKIGRDPSETLRAVELPARCFLSSFDYSLSLCFAQALRIGLDGAPRSSAANREKRSRISANQVVATKVMTSTTVIFCGFVIAASLLGGIVPLATVLTHTRLQLYLSFAAGTMLGATFFHMLPEAVETGSTAALKWSAAGLLALFFLERFFAFHHHEAPEVPDDPCPTHAHEHARGSGHSAGVVGSEAPGAAGPGTKGTALQWRAAAIGLTIHSLVGGVALASASAVDSKAGRAAAWGVFIATVVHKPADALTIVSLMLRAGLTRARAHWVNLGFSLMVPLGAGLFVMGLQGASDDSSRALTASALAFSAGTFLCVALSDLLPELQFHAHDRLKLSISLLAGFALTALSAGG